MKRSFMGLILGLVFLIFIGSQCVFYVMEYERALVLQLGEPTLPVREPGLNFKLPFVQSVVTLDNRVQFFAIPKTYSLSGDFKSFELDNYACWRITDPLLFVRTLRTEAVATERLRNIVYSQLLKAIGKMELKEVVNTKRKAIMDDVLRESRQQAQLYGVHIVDVRIKRTDLPNREAIFKRMNAQRKMMANKYRFEGESEDRRIRSEAELERDRIIAEATRQSLIIRGEADAKAMRIFREAIAASPDFYDFSKSLDVYKKAFKSNTKIIMSKDDPLLRYLQ